GAGKLLVVGGGHELDAVAGARATRLVAFETDIPVGLGPLLDADQQREVAVAQVGREEDLVALETWVRAPELPRPAGGPRPDPPLLAGMTRRDDEVACAGKIVRRSILEALAVLAVRIGPLGDLGLAGRVIRAVKSLERDDALPVPPRGKAVPRLRLRD